MSEVLAKILRPKSLSGLFGQEEIVNAIRGQIKSGRIPQAWLFSGETGSGKTTIARILSQAFNCTHNGIKFGQYCKQCSKTDHGLNVMEVNAAKYRTVEAVESMVEVSTAYPVPPSKYIVITLDEAQLLSREAQNVLLKYFEDAPKTTIWIICTTEAFRIKKALRGRCLSYSLIPLKHKVVEAFIKWAATKGNIKRPLDDFINYIHAHEITSARNILGMLEKFGAGMDPDKAAAESISTVNTLALAKAIAAGEWGRVRPLLDNALASDVRLLRGQLCGFFKQQLMQRIPGMSRKLLVETIEQIANISYNLDDTSQLALLSARVYTLTQKFEKG